MEIGSSPEKRTRQFSERFVGCMILWLIVNGFACT
jgi:hypothetical protein